MPPSQAARALPRLKAPMLAADARVGAPCAWSRTCFCRDRGLLSRYLCPTDRRSIYTDVTDAIRQLQDDDRTDAAGARHDAERGAISRDVLRAQTCRSNR